MSCGQIVIWQKDGWQTFLKFEKFKIATQVSTEIICLDVQVR